MVTKGDEFRPLSPFANNNATSAGMHKDHPVDRNLMNDSITAKYSKKITLGQN